MSNLSARLRKIQLLFKRSTDALHAHYKANNTASAMAKHNLFEKRTEQIREELDFAIKQAEGFLGVTYDDLAPELAGLPSPRLQFRWIKESAEQFTVEYEMVFPLREADVRNDSKSNRCVIHLGSTRVGAMDPYFRPRIADAVPYRDGAHASWDSTLFGELPIYVVAHDGRTALHVPHRLRQPK